jgi:succinate dehydrogenase hydrophobic anchor subunit
MDIIPKFKKRDLILSLFLLLYIIGELYVMFFWKDPFSSNRTQLFQNWIFKILRLFGLSCIIASGFINKIRSIRRDGYAHKKLVIPILLILFCTFMMSVSIYSYFSIIKLRDVRANLQKQLFQVHKDNLKLENLDFDILSTLTKSSAKQYYWATGKNAKYFGTDGNLIQYESTIEDQERVREYQKTDKIFENLNIFKSDILIWPIIVLISILVGLWSPIKTKKPAKYHT